MIVYLFYVFDDQWPFCLVAMATLNFKKGIMSPLLKEGGTYCFLDGSRWCRCQHQHKTSCPLCYLNALWNILMILGRNVEQDQKHVAYKNDNSAFLTFGVISSLYWLSRYLDPVTLTYIMRSSDFDTFYIAVRYLLRYKAYNHQTLHSASPQCTDSASSLTR